MLLAPALRAPVKDSATLACLPVAWRDTGPTAKQMQPRPPAVSPKGGDAVRHLEGSTADYQAGHPFGGGRVAPLGRMRSETAANRAAGTTISTVLLR